MTDDITLALDRATLIYVKIINFGARKYSIRKNGRTLTQREIRLQQEQDLENLIDELRKAENTIVRLIEQAALEDGKRRVLYFHQTGTHYGRYHVAEVAPAARHQPYQEDTRQLSYGGVYIHTRDGFTNRPDVEYLSRHEKPIRHITINGQPHRRETI